jgi:hypothetical protein
VHAAFDEHPVTIELETEDDDFIVFLGERDFAGQGFLKPLALESNADDCADRNSVDPSAFR